mmetsp:Transcript_27814/g.32080  ORF Transcript_27814/g.32080 Transcript_27814/m.32080 type:complete len:768 (-) Transcript_27814:103-2406(-)
MRQSMEELVENITFPPSSSDDNVNPNDTNNNTGKSIKHPTKKQARELYTTENYNVEGKTIRRNHHSGTKIYLDQDVNQAPSFFSLRRMKLDASDGNRTNESNDGKKIKRKKKRKQSHKANIVSIVSKNKHGVTHPPKSRKAPISKPTSFYSPGEDEFNISCAKAISDMEKNLNNTHAASIRLASKSNHLSSSGDNNTSMKLFCSKEPSTTKETTKHKSCVLCLTCPCRGMKSCSKHLVDDDNIYPTISKKKLLAQYKDGLTSSELSILSASEVDVERVMISRLKRLEKSLSFARHLHTRAKRELRRYRLELFKREKMRGYGKHGSHGGNIDDAINKEIAQTKSTDQQGAFSKGTNNNGWFLPDVDEEAVILKNVYTKTAHNINGHGTSRAQQILFGETKTCQPTLTQMFGGNENNQQGDAKSSSCESATDYSILIEEDVNTRIKVGTHAVHCSKIKEDHADIDCLDDSTFVNLHEELEEDVVCQSDRTCQDELLPAKTIDMQNGGKMVVEQSCVNDTIAQEMHPSNHSSDDDYISIVLGTEGQSTAWKFASHNPVDESLNELDGDIESGIVFDKSNVASIVPDWDKWVQDVIVTGTINEDVTNLSGLDQLLDIFNNEVGHNQNDFTESKNQTAAESENTSSLSHCEIDENNQNPEVLSQLSQGGKDAIASMEESLLLDTNGSSKIQTIENICPMWRENIQYAQLCVNIVEIMSALSRIKQSLFIISTLRVKLRDYESVLRLYECSLSKCLSRRQSTANCSPTLQLLQ